MARQTCTIGVDLGTTNAKAAAFDAQGHAIEGAAAETAIPRLLGGAEQDPHAVYAAATAVLAQAAGGATGRGYVVERLGLSAAMHSLVLVASDETPLANALTWMDTRAGAEARALWATPAGRELYARTGTPVAAMSPLVKLLWLRATQPQLFAQARKFVSLKEWVWFQWFGEWCIDASMASATGLYNLRLGNWDVEALALANITPERLSRLVLTTYTRAGLREPALRAAGIAPEAQVTIGASDGVLANLGVGALDSRTLALTIGTSLAVRMGTTAPVTDPVTGLFCYVLDAGHFVAGGPSNSGGLVLDWLYHQVLGSDASPDDHDGFARMLAAASQARTGRLLCLPYVDGERAPLWQANARAVLFGLGLEHTAAAVLRATIEGMLFNAHWIASGLFERLGRPSEIAATGKVLESGWIRQLTADIFGLPVRFLGAVDASL
ncbi:MAG: gluconokinase, partial [Ktedonobacterales bacterium]